MTIYPFNKNVRSMFIIFTMFIFLSACSSTTQTQQQLETTRKEITIIQQQTKELENTTKNTKEKIKELNTLYLGCKINNEFMETQVELMDKQVNLMENTIFNIARELEKLETIADTEIKTCRSENNKLKANLLFMLFAIILLIFLEIKRSK